LFFDGVLGYKSVDGDWFSLTDSVTSSHCLDLKLVRNRSPDKEERRVHH
jgi:hypothetical protein